MHFNVNAFQLLHECRSAVKALNASFLYAGLLGHLSILQTKPRLIIRLSHPVILHCNKKADIIHDMLLCIFFYDQFFVQRMILVLRSTNDLQQRYTNTSARTE